MESCSVEPLALCQDENILKYECTNILTFKDIKYTPVLFTQST